MKANMKTYTFLVLLLLGSLISTPSLAAGSTYKSGAEVDPKKAPLEECRFHKLDRSPEGNMCVYKRQSGGPEVRIGIDQQVTCVQTFRCKMIK